MVLAMALKRLMMAEQECVETPEEKLSAVDAHFQRIRGCSLALHHVNPSAEDVSFAQIRTYVAEAELWRAQARLSPLLRKRAGISRSPARK